MVKEFQEALTRLGIDYEVRSNNAKDDVVTLSDGSKVRLVNPQVVSYQVKGKKRDSISYTIVSSERIRK
jgi:hypothetical protein